MHWIGRRRTGNMHRMVLTVGGLLEYIRGLPPDMPVIVDVVSEDGEYLRVEDLDVTTAQGTSDEMDELHIFWDAPPGWAEAVAADAAQVRASVEGRHDRNEHGRRQL